MYCHIYLFDEITVKLKFYLEESFTLISCSVFSLECNKVRVKAI